MAPTHFISNFSPLCACMPAFTWDVLVFDRSRACFRASRKIADAIQCFLTGAVAFKPAQLITAFIRTSCSSLLNIGRHFLPIYLWLDEFSWASLVIGIMFAQFCNQTQKQLTFYWLSSSYWFMLKFWPTAKLICRFFVSKQTSLLCQ